MLRSKNDIELHVKEVIEKGDNTKIKDKKYKLFDLDSRENDILQELKNTKYNDLEDIVYRMQLTYDEIIDILDLNYLPTKRTGYSLTPGIFEIT